MKDMYLKRPVIVIILIVVASLLSPVELTAQCAMCRASVESSVSNGSGLAEGLNKGILYLMLSPYLILVAIGYAWYHYSKRYTAERKKLAESLKRAF